MLRNAIAPAFERLGSPSEVLSAARGDSLVCTSTPCRGLPLLLELFLPLQQASPDLTLDVFSSLQVYQASSDEDQHEFRQLYQQCQDTPGIRYHGSVP